MTLPKRRTTNYAAFIICVVLLTTAYYLEFVQHIDPCLLCLLQRWLLALVALIFVTAALHNPTGRSKYIYSFLSFIVSLFGLSAAARQVWLEHHPISSGGLCMPGTEYLLRTLPASEIAKRMLQGTSDCSQIAWTLFGLSMATWVLIFFIIFAIISVVQICRDNN